jgi:nucleoside-diphosphate-sugar epimerase
MFVGFGDIARRSARALSAQGWQASGLRRTDKSEEGVSLAVGDCRDVSLLKALLPGQDVVVASFTPDEYSEAGYRAAYLETAEALVAAMDSRACQPRHLIWISSTGVYGEGKGDLVDEATSPAPTRYSGQILLEAENTIRQGPVSATIVRFSGIYGRGAPRVVDQVRSGACAPESPELWTNRIHCDDCAGVVCHLCNLIAEGRHPGEVYVATDCEPVPLHTVHRWLAQKLGVPMQYADSTASHRGNRRCSNQRLLATGYQFRYPSYREGYGAMLAPQS